MLDVVARNHDDGLFGGQSAAEQRGADALCVGEDLRVGKFAPLTLRVPLRKKHAVQARSSPNIPAVGQVVVVAAKTLRGADMNGAVR